MPNGTQERETIDIKLGNDVWPIDIPKGLSDADAVTHAMKADEDFARAYRNYKMFGGKKVPGAPGGAPPTVPKATLDMKQDPVGLTAPESPQARAESEEFLKIYNKAYPAIESAKWDILGTLAGGGAGTLTKAGRVGRAALQGAGTAAGSLAGDVEGDQPLDLTSAAAKGLLTSATSYAADLLLSAPGAAGKAYRAARHPKKFLMEQLKDIITGARSAANKEEAAAAKAATEKIKQATAAKADALRGAKVGTPEQMFPGAAASKPGAPKTGMTTPPAPAEPSTPLPLKATGKGFEAPKATKPTPPPKVEAGDVMKGPTGAQHKAVRAGQEQVARMGERRVVPTSESPVPKLEEESDEDLLRIETGEPKAGRKPTPLPKAGQVAKPSSPAPKARRTWEQAREPDLRRLIREGSYDDKRGAALELKRRGLPYPRYLIE